VRRSILGALVDMECYSELFEVCIEALAGEDMTTQEAAVDALGALAGTIQQQAALSELLKLVNSEYEGIRQHAASALKHYDVPQAKEALSQLRQDSDHRVVGAALENLLEKS
jgi:HEAT repeat protein